MALSPRSIRRNVVKIEANHAGIQERFKVELTPFLEKMTWGQNETILDHGYDSGKKALDILAPIVEKYGSTVYVLDNCPYSIEYASNNYSHPNLKHMLGDLSLSPGTLGDLKFNKIFSIYGFYFIQDYKSALKSMYDHLLPGGEAFFMIPIKSPIFDLDRVLVKHPQWAEHAEGRILTVPNFADGGKEHSGKLKDAFIETGFELKEFVMQDVKHPFKNVKEYADFCSALNPFMLLLPKKSQDELEAFYYKHFLETKTETYTPGVNSPDSEYVCHYTTAYVLVKRP